MVLKLTKLVMDKGVFRSESKNTFIFMIVRILKTLFFYIQYFLYSFMK